jgi:hypothetical protein
MSLYRIIEKPSAFCVGRGALGSDPRSVGASTDGKKGKGESGKVKARGFPL